MEKVGDDGIGGELSGFRKEATIAGDIEESAPMDGGHRNSFFREAWREFSELPEGDDMMFESVRKKRERAKKHVLAPSVSEGLDDVENPLLICHRFRYR